MKQIFSASIGKVSNLHQACVDRYGVHHPYSIELAHLHSRAVDAAKTGDFVSVSSLFHEILTIQYLSSNATVLRYLIR